MEPGRQERLKIKHTRQMIVKMVLLCGIILYVGAASSCKPKIYGGDREIQWIDKGEPMPYDGYAVTQAMMDEIIED